MIKYVFVYKCRLCGNLHKGLDLSDKNRAELALVDALSRHAGSLNVSTTAIHNCFSGNIGVSDLQGVMVDE